MLRLHLCACLSLSTLVALTPSVAAAPEPPLTKWVTAEGMGVSADKGKARDEAITDALRRAVEQGVGLYLKADTLVEDSRLVESHIYTNTEGFVAEHQVTDEKFEADDVCRVTVRARLFLGKLKDALGGLCGDLKLTGNPRVILAVEPPAEGDATTRAAVTGALRQHLVEQGLRVFDQDQLADATRKLLARLRRDGNKASAEALELAEQADLVIKGTVTTRALGKMVDGLDALSGEGTVDLWAAWTDNGQVVAARRCQQKKAAFRQEQAVERALVAAAEQWVSEAMCQVKLVCADPARTYQLTVTGLHSVDALDVLTAQLRQLRFVRAVHERGFDKGSAQHEVEFLGPLRSLRRDVQTLEAIKLEVVSATARTLAVRCRG